ncbi:hypothetical protein IAU60_002027 [Kwoniella sp. DSM 27419]
MTPGSTARSASSPSPQVIQASQPSTTDSSARHDLLASPGRSLTRKPGYAPMPETRGVTASQVPPSTPPRQIRSTVRSPPNTITRAVNTALPRSPTNSDHYYSTSPSRSSPFDNYPSSSLGDVELTPITPKKVFSGYRRFDEDSPFHDRHSILQPQQAPDKNSVENMTVLSDEDPFEYSNIPVAGGKQKTSSGYVFSSLSPRGLDEKGEMMTFGPMLDENRPISVFRRSLYPSQSPIPPSTLQDHPDLLAMPATPSSRLDQRAIQQVQHIRPTFRSLYTMSTRREYLILLLPAFAVAIGCAVIPPYMSQVIGDAFAIFAAYPFNTNLATDQARAALKQGVSETSVKLGVAGILAVLANYLKGLFWVWYGESVTGRLRIKVYNGVQVKSMKWFDLGMGMKEEEEVEGEKKESIGAGGLMSKFARETDDVRVACGLSSGVVIQNIGTFILCFILAMVKSPTLALVTLSTVPLIVVVQITTQVLCAPLYADERRAFAEASTNVERVTSAVATVKIHNAQQAEAERFDTLIGRGKASLIKQGAVWAVCAGLTDFILLGTFVLGFWYGAKIIREGKATSGDVMTCFWACLFSSAYLQQVVPHLTVITKGKNSMASLLTIIQEEPSRPVSGNPFSPAGSPIAPSFPKSTAKIERQSRPVSLQGIRPPRCHGEFNLQNVSFAYPSRADNPVLRDVSLFIPPGETTFIVGGSGSGKSTIAQLLLRLYEPSSGEIVMDNQSFGFLDPMFTREHIAAVQQGCILFDMTVHENVAMGLAGSAPTLDPKTGQKRMRTPKDVTREEVIEACKMAMIHDFIESLPDGYDTSLGTGGSSLSGGQRQRMALARARIRNPTVLILDEATSALDPTSRVLVFQALKAWRNNQTTIVITHDLSQIVSDDFVYVMSHGVIAEQGFRVDLAQKNGGIFAAIAAEQAINPFPAKHLSKEGTEWQKGLEDILDMEREFEEVLDDRDRTHTPSFAGLAGRPGSTYFDIFDEYTKGNFRSSGLRPTYGDRTLLEKRLSKAQKRLTWTAEDLGSRPVSRHSMAIRPGSRLSQVHGSSGMAPSWGLTARQSSFDTTRTPSRGNDRALDRDWTDKDRDAGLGRHQHTFSQMLAIDPKDSLASLEITSDLPAVRMAENAPSAIPSLRSLIKLYFPSMPAKWLLLLGSLGSIGHGITTPVWSFFLAKLMAIVGAGGTDTVALTKFGLIVLALCAAQGFVSGVAEWALVACSARWTNSIRRMAFSKVVKQDKAFFDESKNSSARLVHTLIKDTDDARTIMSQVIGKSLTVATMISMGIIWALVVGWQLTLIGVALGPVFGGYMILDAWLISKQEVRCKAGREAVGRAFYESIANVRGIRAMALDSAFLEKFSTDARRAKVLGYRAAWFIAMSGGVSGGLPLFAQALMNFAGSEFMLSNIMNYQQMLQVYNLVLFSITFGTQMLDFIPTMAKARVAARDFNRLYLLSTESNESRGSLRFPIKGNVTFTDITFAYPTRPDVPVFTGLSLTLTPGECVAIVGPSGSGKSTIAALLQRLYPPTSGMILLDKHDLQTADVKFLRDHIAVVSQSANLFDATIAENIAYGSPHLPLGEIQRAAKSANIHEFIMALPQGYETPLGENAALISGGQAQRLQIARALCRRSNILILDECTSALDGDNARAVLDTIVKIKDSRTTIFITHSVEAMRRCDRIICLGEGRVAEEGTFEGLMAKRGVFAQLMNTGEWE